MQVLELFTCAIESHVQSFAECEPERIHILVSVRKTSYTQVVDLSICCFHSVTSKSLVKEVSKPDLVIRAYHINDNRSHAC